MDTAVVRAPVGVRPVVRAAAVAPLVVLAALALGGCRGAERVVATPAAGPGTSTTAPVATPRANPTGTPGTARPGRPADPVADVEASVDAIARDLDADATAGAGSGGTADR